MLLGSHFLPISDKISANGRTFNGMAWNGGRTLASSAGTIFITQYSIMHRRAASTCQPGATRNMLKYCYYRQATPNKDWADPFTSEAHQSFLRTANFGPHYYPGGYPHGPNLSANKFVAEMYLWLCGRRLPKLMGGQAWPATNFLGQSMFADSPYGFPAELTEEKCFADGAFELSRAKGNPGDNVFWRSSESSAKAESGALREEVVALRRELAAVQRGLSMVLAKL